MEEADILLGYGIADDNSFEDQFSLRYNKMSYGFDCGIQNIESKSKLFTFIPECIGTDYYLYNQFSTNNQITSFSQQLKKLKLENKKIFIKMDIEGAEYQVFPEILNYSNNITGITIEIHYMNILLIKNAINLLKELEKNFVLIHIHGNNNALYVNNQGFKTPNSIGVVPTVMELSYINRSLVKNFHISENQSHPIPMDQLNNMKYPEAKFTILK